MVAWSSGGNVKCTLLSCITLITVKLSLLVQLFLTESFLPYFSPSSRTKWEVGEGDLCLCSLLGLPLEKPRTNCNGNQTKSLLIYTEESLRGGHQISFLYSKESKTELSEIFNLVKRPVFKWVKIFSLTQPKQWMKLKLKCSRLQLDL